MNPTNCSSLDQAWVELYDDHNFEDRGIMMDRVDRFLRNYENYDFVEGFEDKASSAKWCIPPGHRLRLFSDKNPCRGRSRDLIGTGEEDDLGDINMGDRVSCSRWLTF